MDKDIKPDWSQLAKGHCPLCEDYMHEEGTMVHCDRCDFRIGKKKYLDLVKRKESKPYRKRVENIKRSHLKTRRATEFQNANKDRLLSRPMISVEI